jgi:hypothetical protein
MWSPNDKNLPMPSSPPKKTFTQMNTNQKQTACKARLDKMHHYKHTFKRAIITNVQEKAKEKDGLSAKGVCNIIKEVFNVNLYPRTIQKK